MEKPLVESYQCELCKDVFKTKSDFIDHIKFVHQFNEDLNHLLFPAEDDPSEAEQDIVEEVSTDLDEVDLVADPDPSRQLRNSCPRLENENRAQGSNPDPGSPIQYQACNQVDCSFQRPENEDLATEAKRAGYLQSPAQHQLNFTNDVKIQRFPGVLGNVPVRTSIIRPGMMFAPRGQAGNGSLLIPQAPGQLGNLPSSGGHKGKFLTTLVLTSNVLSGTFQPLILNKGDISKPSGSFVERVKSPRVLTLRPNTPSRFIPILPKPPAHMPPDVVRKQAARPNETPRADHPTIDLTQSTAEASFSASNVLNGPSAGDPDKREVNGPAKSGPHVICWLCKKPKRDSYSLRHHIQAVHQNLRPHVCRFCAKTFKRRDHLKNHSRIVHRAIS